MNNRKRLNIELDRLSPEEYRATAGSGIAVVLDNVRSAHNVGSAFRSADAFKADKVVLCGICAVPPSAEIHKTALGAEDSVPWEHFDRTSDAVEALRAEGYTLVTVEQTVHSVSLESFCPEPGKHYAIVFDASDLSLEIPQWGTKHSLNVSVTVGIVLWHFRLQRR